MSRLIIVSNRTASPQNPASGGLAVGLRDAAQRSKGLWVGWSGDISDDTEARSQLYDGYILLTHDLSKAEHEDFYNGFSNSCLWPVLHGRGELLEFHQHYLDSYLAVNERIAATVAKASAIDDRIWVHDFHFWPLAYALRQRGVECPLSLFLHTPFPEVESFAALPAHKQLLERVLEFDVIGFQTQRDQRHFSQALDEVLGHQVHNNHVQLQDRSVQLLHLPIGIDTDKFEELATEEQALEQVDRIKQALNGRRQIIGVDRLDYSKGLPHRVESYSRLLEQYPEFQRKIEVLQIATLSRGEVDAYQDLREHLEQRIAHVNGHYGDVDWVPLRYINKTQDRAALAGLYRASAVGLVTPLKDGMNLVAKEYVASQDPDDPGVLVLSCFAGAAEEMQAAVVVNPHSPERCAEGLAQALNMPLKERRARHAELISGLRKHSIQNWVNAFEQALLQISQPDTQTVREADSPLQKFA